MSLGTQFQSVVHGVASNVTTGALATAMVVAGMTHETPKGGYVGTPEQVSKTNAAKPSNEPRWNKSLGRQFEGFSDMSTRPKSAIPSHVVAVHQNASASRMSFDRAYSLNTDNERANDVWTVGWK